MNGILEERMTGWMKVKKGRKEGSEGGKKEGRNRWIKRKDGWK